MGDIADVGPPSITVTERVDQTVAAASLVVVATDVVSKLDKPVIVSSEHDPFR